MTMNKYNYEYFLIPKIEIDQNHKNNQTSIGNLLHINNNTCT